VRDVSWVLPRPVFACRMMRACTARLHAGLLSASCAALSSVACRPAPVGSRAAA
jgi:hypothetical protein